MAKRFEATISLPPLAAGEAGEVVSRQFTRQVNGEEPSVETIEASEGQRVFGCTQGDVLHLELRNVFAAGNVSATVNVLDFTVNDTAPPAARGELAVSLRELR